jgi:hypothetical protein
MSHPRSLIEAIAAKLHGEYPPDSYIYRYEVALAGTRLFPDIQVCERDSGKTLCAVEIGYTRPEKLTAYRTKHAIPDVRWYDKAGRLHGDVQEITVQATVLAPEPELGARFACYRPEVSEPCPRCVDSGYEELRYSWPESPVRPNRRPAGRRVFTEWMLRNNGDGRFDGMNAAEIEEAYEQELEALLIEAADATESLIGSDSLRMIVAFRCKACGFSCIATAADDEVVPAGLSGLLSDNDGRALATECGARRWMTWTELRAAVQALTGNEPVYADAPHISPEHEEYEALTRAQMIAQARNSAKERARRSRPIGRLA